MTDWGYITANYLDLLDRLTATDKQRALDLFCEALDRAAAGQVVTGPAVLDHHQAATAQEVAS